MYITFPCKISSLRTKINFLGTERRVSNEMAKTKATHRGKHLLLTTLTSNKEELCWKNTRKKKSPQQHTTPTLKACGHKLFGYINAILEQSEFWASQHNSRNSHILLCGPDTQKLNHLCKPAPCEAKQALSWQSPHTARKQCLVLKTLPIYFFC